jgi:hypothetical protein
MAEGKCLVRNAKGAPAADGALLVEVGPSPTTWRSEALQTKQLSAEVTAKSISEERLKACDKDDFFLVLCSGDKNVAPADLPINTGIVTRRDWEAFFGPYLGRAFLFSVRERRATEAG